MAVVQGTRALFRGPEDIPEGPAVTLRLQRGGVFAADVIMEAALLQPPPPLPPAEEVQVQSGLHSETAGWVSSPAPAVGHALHWYVYILLIPN